MYTESVHPGPDKEVPVHQKSEKGAYNVKLHMCAADNDAVMSLIELLAGVKTSSLPKKVTGMCIMHMSILRS